MQTDQEIVGTYSMPGKQLWRNSQGMAGKSGWGTADRLRNREGCMTMTTQRQSQWKGPKQVVQISEITRQQSSQAKSLPSWLKQRSGDE